MAEQHPLGRVKTRKQGRHLNDEQREQLRATIRAAIAENPRAITPRVIAACQEQHGFTVTGPTVSRYWREVIEEDGSPEPPEGKDPAEVKAAIEQPSGSHPHRATGKVGPITIARPFTPRESRAEASRRVGKLGGRPSKLGRKKIEAEITEYLERHPGTRAKAVYRALEPKVSWRYFQRIFGEHVHGRPTPKKKPRAAVVVQEEEDRGSRDRDEAAQPPEPDTEGEAEAAPLTTPAALVGVDTANDDGAWFIDITAPGELLAVLEAEAREESAMCGVTEAARGSAIVPDLDPHAVTAALEEIRETPRITHRSPLGVFVGEQGADGRWRIVEFRLANIEHERFLEFAADAAELLFPLTNGGS